MGKFCLFQAMLGFLLLVLFCGEDSDGAQSRGSWWQAGVLPPKSPADSKVLPWLGAGRQQSKCHPLAAERAKDLSPASGRCQGTVACFLILAGRLAGISPRQTSLVPAQPDLLPWLLFQAASRLPGGGVLVGGRGEIPALLSKGWGYFWACWRQQTWSLVPTVGREMLVGMFLLMGWEDFGVSHTWEAPACPPAWCLGCGSAAEAEEEEVVAGDHQRGKRAGLPPYKVTGACAIITQDFLPNCSDFVFWLWK